MNYIRLIRSNPDFSKLWLAQVITLLGDWFSTIALAALISQFTRGTDYEGLAISGFLLARLFPPLIASPIAGVIADRFSRKSVLIASDILRAIVVLLLLLANDPSRLWLIYVLVIIQFALSAVFEPARNALLPHLLDREDLVLGNTLGSVTWSVMLAIGAIVGGVVASLFGITTALIIDAMTFLVSAVLVWQIQVTESDKRKNEDIAEEDDRSFREGLRYLRRNPDTIAAVLAKALLHIGSVDTVLIVYGTVLFVIGENGTTSLAILWSAFGIGALLGPIILNPFVDGSARNLRRMIIFGFAFATIGWFIFGVASTLFLVCIGVVIRAMGGSIDWTYSSVLIQTIVPDEYLGRMFSIDMAGFQLMSGISVIVVGALVDAVGSENVRQVVLWMGGVSIIPLIIWIWIVWRLERRHQKPASLQAAGD